MAKKPIKKIVTKKERSRLEKENLQRRIITLSLIAVVILVIGVIVYGVLDQVVLKASHPVAVVNGDKITLDQFQQKVRYSRYQLVQQYINYYQIYQMFSSDASFASSFADNMSSIQNQLAASNENIFGSGILEQMIQEVIIAQQAKVQGITISEEEIDSSLQDSFAYYPNGSPTPTITPTEVTYPAEGATQGFLVSPTPTATMTLVPTATSEATQTPTATEIPATATPTNAATIAGTIAPTEGPTATETPYTLEGYQTQLSNYETQLKDVQLSEQFLRDSVRSYLLRQKMVAFVTADLKPEQEQVWARHILVADEATATAVRERLAAGEDWNTVAAELSTDTATKDKGGDLGWFGKGIMDTTFEESAFSLAVGEISQPIQTQFGWHIIQVIDHAVRPLTASEFASYKQQTFTNWLDDQVTASTISRDNIWETNIPQIPTIPPELILTP
jgi:peptidyl-prolyl cis-trans isomerase D